MRVSELQRWHGLASGRIAMVCTMALMLSLAPGQIAFAQDLVITNARIIDGTGQTIERGSIAVAGERISSVSGAIVDPGHFQVIDAQGMTVLPGFIDTHRHDIAFGISAAEVAAALEAETPANLGLLLDEGFTTVMMPGTYLAASLDVRKRLAESRIRGPRLFFSGPAFTAPGGFPIPVICQGSEYCADNATVQVTDPRVARREVRRLVEAGVDGIKVMLDPSSPLDGSVIAAVIDETRGLGLRTMLHAHRVEDMLMGARLGGARLVHTPSDVLIASGPGARILRENGIAISTTVSFTAPQFAEATGAAYGRAARHRVLLENIRHLMDEGVVVAFGTDSPPFVRPMVEIQELSRVLAPVEVIATLTRNAAVFLDQLDQIGTLEAGKVADIVMVDGDPLADVTNLGRIKLVLLGGKVVVDKR
jgi:imidazolonepropionase-like amidohydrolase